MTYAGNKEQASTRTRVVGDVEPREYFLSSHKPLAQPVKHIFHPFTVALIRFNLTSFENLRGEIGDGGSNVKGLKKRLHARIQQNQPLVPHLRTLNHCKRLYAVRPCSVNAWIWKTRLECLLIIQSKGSLFAQQLDTKPVILSPNPLCPARLTIWAKATSSVSKQYDTVLSLLQNEYKLNPESGKSVDLYRQLQKGYFYSLLLCSERSFN